MPARIRALDNERLERQVVVLGRRIRQRRKALGVTMTAAAEAAGMSRVTWHRIEKGETSVTIAAWFNALAVLGLEFGLGEEAQAPMHQSEEEPGVSISVPVAIRLADFPQLQALAWQVTGVDTLHPREALDIYQRNRRHIDWDSITPQERDLVSALTEVFRERGSV